MAAWSKPAKIGAAALLVLTAVVFAPVFPSDPVRGDPIAPSDPRIHAHISPTDLAKILQLVRGNRFSSIYQNYFVQTQLPLRSVIAASQPLLIGPGRQAATVAPPGEIQATFAAGCRPDCQEGVTYYFTRHSDSWRITKIERWVV